MKQNNNDNILDKVISAMTKDTEHLQAQIDIIDKAKQEKRETQQRLKHLQRDLATFIKYASDQQLERIEKLGIDHQHLGASLNPIAQSAWDILQKQPKGEMTNEALYLACIKSLEKEDNEISYTDFNIKIRSLLSTQKIIRVEKEGQSSRKALIRINGFRSNKTD